MVMRSALLAIFVASLIARLTVSAAAKAEPRSESLEEFGGLRKEVTSEERALTGRDVCDNNKKRNKRRKSRFSYYIEFIGINGKFGRKQKKFLADAFVDVYNEFIGGCSDKPYQRFIHNVKITKQCLFDDIDDMKTPFPSLQPSQLPTGLPSKKPTLSPSLQPSISLQQSHHRRVYVTAPPPSVYVTAPPPSVYIIDYNHRNLRRNRDRSIVRFDGTVSCGNACEDEDEPLFEEAVDDRMLMHRMLKNKKQSPAGSGTCCKYKNHRILKGNTPRCKSCPLVNEFRIELNRVLQGLVKEGKIRGYNKIGDITTEVPDIDVCNFSSGKCP